MASALWRCWCKLLLDTLRTTLTMHDAGDTSNRKCIDNTRLPQQVMWEHMLPLVCRMDCIPKRRYTQL